MKIAAWGSRYRRAHHSKRREVLLFRLSRAYTDVILLAQALGVLANFIWYTEISTSDLVGFIYVGGDIAGLFAYFGFMLFGMLFFWLAPRRFWLSLHPVTLGMALLMLASHRLWNANGLLLTLAVLVGALTGRFIYRFMLLYPRAALMFAAVFIPLGRFVMPRELAPYAITCLGALLIMLVCAPVLLRRLQKR